MKMVLITPTPPDISAFGIRSLSAYLRANGHETTLVFLPGSIGLLKEGGDYVYRYDPAILDQILQLCSGADLLGLSFMTNYFDRAVQITGHIKRNSSIPVIWGGIHASIKPDEALQHADMVCLGEGEEALRELLNSMQGGAPDHDIAGIWFKHNGEVTKNPLRPLITGLDTLPFCDFSNLGHFILNKETRRITPMNDALLDEAMPLLPRLGGGLLRAFRIMTDRGCPHMCSYCNVPTLKQMYKNDKSPYLRARSAEHAIEELVQITKRYPFIRAIQIFDDTFFARPRNYMENFARLYRKQVGLPLYCQASPQTISPEKLDILLGAGLVYVEMGIQTGSERIRKLYLRKESNEQILEAAQLLHCHIGRMIRPDYHIIIDNPWETQEDVLETAKLLAAIPKPYGLAISSLTFFPRTGLYDKALQDGIIADEVTDIYRKPFYVPPKKTYANFLIYLCTFPSFPRFIMSWLLRDKTVARLSGMNLSFLYGVLYKVGETFRFAGKGAEALRRRDWARIALFFRKLRIHDPVVAGRKG